MQPLDIGYIFAIGKAPDYDPTMSFDFGGIRAGTLMKAVATSVWLNKLEAGPRPGPQLMAKFFDPGGNFSIRPIR